MKMGFQSEPLIFPKVMLVASIVHYLFFFITFYLLGLTNSFTPTGTFVVLSVLVGVPYLVACVGGVIVYGRLMLKGQRKFNEIVTLIMSASMFVFTSLLALLVLLSPGV